MHGSLGEDGKSPIGPRVDPKLKEEVRTLMRKVPASVAVITVAHYDAETEENVPMGIAVSSLNTVTLDPPTISFNIKQPSKALDAIRAANGRFRVHFLESTPPGRKVIELFCNGNHPAAYDQRLNGLSIRVPRTEETSSATVSLAPQIHGTAVRAAAECTLTHEFTVADHVILVAQIKGLEAIDSENPTIAYVNGTYRQIGSKGVLGAHGKKQEPATQRPDARHGKLDRALELQIIYQGPVLYGEDERRQFADRLESYIGGMEGLRFIDHRELIKKLQPETRLLSTSFGVNLVHLIHSLQDASDSRQQTLPEFYGQLSPARMEMLVDRMKQLVKADSRFLEVQYTDLLNYLDVAVGGTSILPSDLLNPLRADGLVGPFESKRSMMEDNGEDRNIFVLEQVEHAIRGRLLSMSDKDILRSKLLPLLQEFKLPPADLMHLREPLTRLKVETAKTFFASWKIDIAGEVTPEEKLVIIRRIVDYLGVDRRNVYRGHMLEREADIVRNVGVHPLVVGVNFIYLIQKIRYLYATVEFEQLEDKVEEMLQPHFASSVQWEDLETRIRTFVQKLPLRATAWKNRDILAAMGLSGKTIIKTPLSATEQTIADSNLLDTLVAKALKNHYGNGTEEENHAIAAFLEDRYGFDVVSRSAVVSPEAALARSSADDLEAARLQHEEPFVPIRKAGAKD